MSTPAEELRGLLLETFPQPDNRAAVEWLSRCTSAHGDLAERLADIIRPLRLTIWEPDGEFPFVVVVDGSGLIRGAAVGMTDTYVRLPRHLDAAATEDGERVIEAGPGWYCFAAFDVDVSKDEQVRRLRRWFEAALDKA
jgi:hypothetical protein